MAIDDLPEVLADQAKGIGVAAHQAVGVGKRAGGIAVAVGHLGELPLVVVAITHQGLDGCVGNDALDRGQSAKGGLVVQVQPYAAWCADVGEAAVGVVGEVQVVAQCVFQALQGHLLVVVGYFAEVEKQVVERLQEVMATEGAHQRQLLVWVVDALARLDIGERNTAPLVVLEVHEAPIAAQALLPGQGPAAPEHAAGIEVAGVET
ncbi:hypothetical protein D3C81_1433790 [compost metagenome]